MFIIAVLCIIQTHPNKQPAMRASRPTLLAALLLALALAARPAAAASRASRICIDVGPYLTQGVRVLVGGVDNSDWDGDSRPDKVLHNAIVMPGQPLCRRLEVRRGGGAAAFA